MRSREKKKKKVEGKRKKTFCSFRWVWFNLLGKLSNILSDDVDDGGGDRGGGHENREKKSTRKIFYTRHLKCLYLI